MGNFKNHQYFLMFFIALLLLACKKNKTGTEKPIPEGKTASQIFVPVKLESTNLTITLKYKDHTTLLSSIEDTDGNKTAIAYNSKLQLSTLEKYRNNKLYYAAYYESSAEKMVQRVNQFAHDPVFDSFTPIGFYTLAYNHLLQLTELKYYNSNSTENLIKTCSRSYSPSQNLSAHAQTTYQNQTNLFNYTFDNKKGIVSHIAESRWLALESEYGFLHNALNNILTYSSQQTPVENTSFSYEYNTEGYPSKMTINSNNNIQHLKITYKALPVN